MKSQSPRNGSKEAGTAALEAATLNIKPGREDELATFIDLSGLVYDKLDHPIILVGLPKEYSGDFQQTFFKKGSAVPTKKANGNRFYTRISRAADVYRLCKAVGGRTKIHQRALEAIERKLEQKYGKANLEAML